MKYILTIIILVIFTAGIRAQENDGYCDEGGIVSGVEKVTASGAGLNTTFLKKHQGEFKVSELILKREKSINTPIICTDDDTCGDNGNNCRSNTFIWGAISIVAGLLAFTGIRK